MGVRGVTWEGTLANPRAGLDYSKQVSAVLVPAMAHRSLVGDTGPNYIYIWWVVVVRIDSRESAIAPVQCHI